MRKIIRYALAFFVLTAFLISSPTYATTMLGDSNVEVVSTSLVPQYVMALTKFTATSATTITSISLYISYTGSDGSQCIKFGVYDDNGGPYGQSNPLGQPLVAATHNGYCLQTGNFGPAWETWTLQPGDQMAIGAGTYWLTTLASKSLGTIYHFTYTGAYGGQYLYQYGYFYYGFPASYTLGYPPTVFGPTDCTLCQPATQPLYPSNAGEYNAPFSFYANGS